MRSSERRRENEILIDFELLQVDYSALTLTIPKTQYFELLVSFLHSFNNSLIIKINEMMKEVEKGVKITNFYNLNYKMSLEVILTKLYTL